MSNAIIELKAVAKSFGDNRVIPTLNLEIRRGEFLTLLGPSGCGKTTLLRIIAGFESPSAGRVFLDGTDITDLPPYRREVNTVFQNYALFPHLSVFDNVAFGLRQKGISGPQLQEEVKNVLEMVQMADFSNRKPRELSGGQQQRIALARAIVNRPKVLLLDEPLAALDLKLRKQMQFELKSLHEQLGITFVFVTHDQEEALTMSDRIAVMNKGRIDQLDSPVRVYDHPKTRFVADFVGENNTLEGDYDAPGKRLRKDGFDIAVTGGPQQSGKALLFIRPEHISIVRQKPDNQSIALPARIETKTFLGNQWKIRCRLEDGGMDMDVTIKSDEAPLLEGLERVYLSWKPEKATLAQ
jgi:spermidine/putrescine transport system ATP-binding protein